MLFRFVLLFWPGLPWTSPQCSKAWVVLGAGRRSLASRSARPSPRPPVLVWLISGSPKVRVSHGEILDTENACWPAGRHDFRQPNAFMFLRVKEVSYHTQTFLIVYAHLPWVLFPFATAYSLQDLRRAALSTSIPRAGAQLPPPPLKPLQLVVIEQHAHLPPVRPQLQLARPLLPRLRAHHARGINRP